MEGRDTRENGQQLEIRSDQEASQMRHTSTGFQADGKVPVVPAETPRVIT